MGTFNMKTFFVIASIVAIASAAPEDWQNCNDWCDARGGFLTTDYVLENWNDGNTLPGMRGDVDKTDCVPSTNWVAAPVIGDNRNYDLYKITTDLGPAVPASMAVSVWVDDDLHKVYFNGVDLNVNDYGYKGCPNADSGRCATDERIIELPVDLFVLGGPNVIEIYASNHGGPGGVDITTCTTERPTPQVVNPAEPVCRQKFVNETDGELHLVTREDGTMGCQTDEECIQYTNPDSWCTADGTCAGCDDWEGCCDLLPEAPVYAFEAEDEGEPDSRIVNPEEPACRQYFLEDDVEVLALRPNDAMGCISDQECIDNTSPSSWCKEDGTCRGCGDWEGCCGIEA